MGSRISATDVRGTVLVIGGSGFIGSAFARRISNELDVRVRWAQRSTGVGVRPRPIDELLHLDLAVPSSLRAATQGVDVVVHLATKLAGTSAELDAVNHRGSRALVDLADSTGVRRVVRLSTAAVYGAGPWTGDDISDLPLDPRSVVSETRCRGDEAVLEAGGTVVRPHLVLGPGDRWVAPRIRAVTSRIGWIDGGAARHSIIDVETLAALIWQETEAALSSTREATSRGDGGRVRLAADPVPVQTRNLPIAALEHVPDGGTLEAALAHPAGVADPRWRHDVLLLGTDHWLTDRRS